MEHKQKLADASILLVALIWGFGFVITKNALDHFGPYAILMLRFLLAAATLFILVPKLFVMQSKTSWMAAAVTGTVLFFAFALQTVGLIYTTASKQAFITGFSVVLVPLFGAAVYKRPLRTKEIVSAVLCIVGIGILSLDDISAINLGDFLTLLCAVCFAIHILIVGRFADKMDAVVYTTGQFLFAGLWSFAAFWFLEGAKLPPFSPTYAGLMYLTLGSTVICFLVMTIAQKYTTSNRVALFLSLEAVIGGACGVLFSGDPLTARLWIGGLLVFGSIVWVEMEKPDEGKLPDVGPINPSFDDRRS